VIGRITNWYSVYHAWKLDSHTNLHHLHQKYGDIVRIGPNRISVNNREGLNAIYGKGANVRTSSSYSLFIRLLGHKTVASINGKKRHEYKRAIIEGLLSDGALMASERCVSEKLESPCKPWNRLALPRKDGQSHFGAIRMKLCSQFALDIMSGILFGHECNISSSLNVQHNFWDLVMCLYTLCIVSLRHFACSDVS